MPGLKLMRGGPPQPGKQPGYGFACKAGYILLCFILIGCTDSGTTRDKRSESAPRTGGTYRIPLLNNPNGFDPIRAEDQYSTAVIYQLFDGLVRFGPDLLVIPALAESWQIGENGLFYRFLLRNNARFHNGKPVTSEDVLFSLTRLIKADPAPTILPYMLKILGAEEYRSGQTTHLSGVQVINEREIEIRLKEPCAPFLAALGMHQTRIVPMDEVEKQGDQFARNPVGAGPFAFVSWENNQTVRLKRFSDYYQGPAFLDGIEFIIYPGGNFEQILADFQNRRLHEMPAHDGRIREQLRSLKGVRLVRRTSASLLFYGMNCQDPVLKHPEVRRALSLAIDRRRLASEVWEDPFKVARSLIPPGILGYNPENLRVEDDLSKAQQELKKFSGTSASGLTLEVVSNMQYPAAIDEMKLVADCWKKLGVTLKPKFVPDWKEFEQYIQSPSMQIYRYVWYMDIPDPDNIVQPLFGSDSKVNYIRYTNFEVDQALRAARLMLNSAERAASYHKIEGMIINELPIIPLVHLNIDQAYRSNVNGNELSALGRQKTSLYGVWLSPEE